MACSEFINKAFQFSRDLQQYIKVQALNEEKDTLVITKGCEPAATLSEIGTQQACDDAIVQVGLRGGSGREEEINQEAVAISVERDGSGHRLESGRDRH